MVVALIALFSLFFSLAFPQDLKKSEAWEKTYSVDPSRPIYFSFRDVDGDLRVITHEKPNIKIKTIKEALTSDKGLANRLLAGTKIQVNQKDNRLDLEIVYPRLRALFFPFRDYRRVKVSTEVSLPLGANLKASLVDGQAIITGKLKEVQVTTVDGSIWLENSEGQFNLKTVDGRITFSQGKGQAEIITVDGDIIMEGEIEPLRVQTTDGDIKIEVNPGTKINQPWQLRTVSGDIDLSLPVDLSADLELETIDSSLRCDLKLVIQNLRGKGKISGRLNHGGPLISLKTVDGRIWIKEKSI